MGLVGREIVQERIWIDPSAPPPPSLNYKETFPYTVFDAVRLYMDKEGPTLTDILEKIKIALDNKQPIFPSKPSNYLMTFAGEPGAVGAIAISQDIPWDPTKQRTDKIPSERAVGKLLYTLGLVNEDGSIDEDGRKIRWSDIIGRPLMYDSLGTNDDGFMTQKAINNAINEVRALIVEGTSDIDTRFDVLNTKITNHIYDSNNPHNVTIDQIGGVSKEELHDHLDQVNPHGITTEILGLENVDNTSDIDKPISKATQDAIDAINRLLESITNGIDDINYIEDITYDQKSGTLTVIYHDGSRFTLHIPIDGLVDEISYDKETKELVIMELGGESKRISISDLFVRYLGSVGTNITVIIDDYNDDQLDWLNEINRSTVKRIWNSDGDGYRDPVDGETPKTIIDVTWENNGDGYQEPEDAEMNYGLTKQIWDSDGAGYVEPIFDQKGDPQKSGYHIIRAKINPLSITSEEMSNDSVDTRVIKDQSVTDVKIRDLCITTIKLSDRSVTTEKIDELAIVNSRLANRSVNGRVLFSSIVGNRILAVLEANSDPVWTQIIAEMISSHAIETRHISNGAVITGKIHDHAVTASKINNNAVTNTKLAPYSVTNDKIANSTITGDKIVTNPVFNGVVRVTERPSPESDGNEVPDTRWICDKIKSIVITNENIGDRIIDGKSLFTSSTRHRALVVLRANSDPVWGTIDNEMMADYSVGTRNLIDSSVIGSKIKDKSIENKHMTRDSVSTYNIMNDAITSEKIFKSNTANRVLGALADDSNPVYTQITRDMISNYAVSAMQIEDRSITLAKLKTSDVSNRILGVVLRNTEPIWMQVTNQMIADRAIDGRTLFTAPGADLILGVTAPGIDPAWLKVGSKMLDERIIKREHIDNGAVWQEHLQEKIIESRHIMDWTIKQNNIAPRAITGTELFTSPIPNRVLAVTTSPYSNPSWMQVTTDMIEDGSVTREKIMQSDNPYRVLGATQAGVPPEYTMITHQFIVDGTIIPQKLVQDFTLLGTPSLTIPPDEDASNRQLANTSWVRSTVAKMLTEFDPTILFDVINSDTVKQMIKEAIEDKSIDGRKLFTHPVGPRVLGITKANEDVEFLLIEEDLIADGAVTSNKIQRDVHLLGSPVIEIRPPENASDRNGYGHLIPDCQWVINKIGDGIKYVQELNYEMIKHIWDTDGNGYIEPGDSSTSGGIVGGGNGSSIELKPDSILTEYIRNRAITGDKLFTSSTANKVLAVIDPNSNPQYTTINNQMIADRAIDGRTLFTSRDNERLLGVMKAGESPSYIKVTHNMIDDNSVGSNNIINGSVTGDKIADESITLNKFAPDALFIDSSMLADNSIITQKIADRAVTTDKIHDRAVTGDKLAKNLILPIQTTVEQTAPETKSVRNITISPNVPTSEDGEDGDIWITYI